MCITNWARYSEKNLLRIFRERDSPKSRFSILIFFQNFTDFREILSVRRVLFFDCILISGSSLLRRRSYVTFCQKKNKKDYKLFREDNVAWNLISLQVRITMFNLCATQNRDH